MIFPDTPETRERAAREVAAGGVVAFRTDTFYGLGADPFNPAALRALKHLKGSDDGKPILVVVSDAQQSSRFFAGETETAEKVARLFWPGALTLVAEARDDVPQELTAGTSTVGVRLPDDELVRDFVRACGGALTATSANPSSCPPARSAREVADYFPEGLALIVDGGPAQSEQPSTVLGVSGAGARLIREGVVTRETILSKLLAINVILE